MILNVEEIQLKPFFPTFISLIATGATENKSTFIKTILKSCSIYFLAIMLVKYDIKIAINTIMSTDSYPPNNTILYSASLYAIGISNRINLKF